jgi:hypothetical protein
MDRKRLFDFFRGSALNVALFKCEEIGKFQSRKEILLKHFLALSVTAFLGQRTCLFATKKKQLDRTSTNELLII